MIETALAAKLNSETFSKMVQEANLSPIAVVGNIEFALMLIQGIMRYSGVARELKKIQHLGITIIFSSKEQEVLRVSNGDLVISSRHSLGYLAEALEVSLTSY